MDTLTKTSFTKSKNFGLSIIRGNETSDIDELLAIGQDRKEFIENLVNCEKFDAESSAHVTIKSILETVSNPNELAYAMFYYGKVSDKRAL